MPSRISYCFNVSIAGIICIHITNTYLNLYPVVKNAAEQVLEMKYTSVYKESDTKNLLQRNHYFMISNDQAFLDQIPMLPRFVSKPATGSGQGDKKAVDVDWPGISLWTDHYSTIFIFCLMNSRLPALCLPRSTLAAETNC